MARKAIGGLFFADDSLEDGYVEASGEGTYPDLAMTMATWLALQSVTDANRRLVDALLHAERGSMHLIPRSVIEADVAAEVRLGLALVEPEPSQWCLYPPCGQDAVTSRDGMPLCQYHDELMQGWDDLVA
jgi:hypothetical protein